MALFLIIFPLICWSESKQLVVDGKTYVLLKKDAIWISDGCLRNKCQALKIQKKPLLSDAHPAAELCEKAGARYLVGRYPSGDMDGICLFKDDSFILGWDFYYRNGSND